MPTTNSPVAGPTNQSQCYEEVADIYLKRLRPNGNPVTSTCKNLSRQDSVTINTFCTKDESGAGFYPAKITCPVTCNQCGTNGCNEKSNTGFYWKTKSSGSIVTKNCSFLKQKMDNGEWNQTQLNRKCSRVSPNGTPNGNSACPITCGTCQ